MIVSPSAEAPSDNGALFLFMRSSRVGKARLDNGIFISSLAAAGAVVMSMHSSLSPLVDVALMVMSALARLLGRAADNRISTGTLTAPAANGHLTPSYVMEPTPNGRVNVCAAHTSPE